ncbi:unnamed protein product [Dicrocoelium dendriticum]|nr:unnamed protein product [Dicrocoelium dendriticum]
MLHSDIFCFSAMLAFGSSRAASVFPLCVTLRRMSSKVSEVGVTNIQDEADFQKRVLNNEKPVLVDFHATWCVSGSG